MQYKSNSKQRYRSIQGLRSFKDTLPTKVKKILKKKGHIFSETLDNWRYIVGDELFKVCYPKSFKSSNKFSSSTNYYNHEKVYYFISYYSFAVSGV